MKYKNYLFNNFFYLFILMCFLFFVNYCSDSSGCPSGTHEQGGECLPNCAEGTYLGSDGWCHPLVDADADADVDADTDTDSDGDSDTDSDGDTDTDSDGDTDSDTDTDTDTDSDIDSDADTDADVNVRSCTSIISYNANNYGSASVIAAAGEWNDWSTTADVLTDPDGDGIFTVELELDPGEYAYKIVKDGDWILDPQNTQRKWFGDSSCCENSNLIVQDCDTPMLTPLNINVDSSSGKIELEVKYIDGAQESGPDVNTAKVTVNRTQINDNVFDANSKRFNVVVENLSTNRYTFRFNISDEQGRAADELMLPVWIENQEWGWEDALIYFALTDRFADGDPDNNKAIASVETPSNYQGGDIAGIIEKLEQGYFDDLGVTAIWITPVIDNPDDRGMGSDGHYYSGYHGYWPDNPQEVESHLGDIDLLRELSTTAHQHGIRILLDIVLNHVYMDHPWYTQHADWFNGDGSCICGVGSCTWESRPIDCWFRDYLPDINYTNHDAVIAFIDEALWWVNEIDVDAFRVDAVKHFPHLVSRRLAGFVHILFELSGNRFYLVGETFAGAEDADRNLIKSFIDPNNAELDGQFDFPICWGLRSAYAENNSDGLTWLDSLIRANEGFYPSGTIMSPFLGNHDIPRFISLANGDDTSNPWTNPPPEPATDTPYQMIKLAFATLLTLPGAPLIYYGDEIGMPGAGDPDNRRFMIFDNDLNSRQLDVLDFVQKLGQARRDNIVLRRGNRETILVNNNMYVYSREYNSDVAVIVINRSSSPTTQSINVSTTGLSNGAVLVDVISGQQFTVNSGSIPITISAQTAMVLLN